jgi:site-specific recombinase XerD
VRRLLKAAGVHRVSQIEAEPIQAAAKRLMDDGLAPRTANAGVKAARQFSTWLLHEQPRATDVLHRRLQTYNEAVDQRRLPPRVVGRGVRAAARRRPRRPPRSGLRGPDRAMLYQVAVGTGFRQRRA